MGFGITVMTSGGENVDTVKKVSVQNSIFLFKNSIFFIFLKKYTVRSIIWCIFMFWESIYPSKRSPCEGKEKIFWLKIMNILY